MILIDTSSWVEAMRPKGNPAVKARVTQILEDGEAAWCDVVRAELWMGAHYGHEQKLIRLFEKDVVGLPINRAVWDETIRLSMRTRSAGLTLPVTDLIIFACAQINQVPLEHSDEHFERLRKLK